MHWKQNFDSLRQRKRKRREQKKLVICAARSQSSSFFSLQPTSFCIAASAALNVKPEREIWEDLEVRKFESLIVWDKESTATFKQTKNFNVYVF